MANETSFSSASFRASSVVEANKDSDPEGERVDKVKFEDDNAEDRTSDAEVVVEAMCRGVDEACCWTSSSLCCCCCVDVDVGGAVDTGAETAARCFNTKSHLVLRVLWRHRKVVGGSGKGTLLALTLIAHELLSGS